MRASDLVALLQDRIAEFGDQDVALVQQTGPDSFQIVEVTEVGFGTLDDNNSCMVIE